MMRNQPQAITRQVQPSALHYSPGFQRYDLPPKVLCEVVPNPRVPNVKQNRAIVQGSPDATIEFFVTTPEVRARIKGALIWVPGAGEDAGPDSYWIDPATSAHVNRFGLTTLWLAKRECSLHGSGSFVPIENLAGDIYAGEPIPDIGNMGYVFEVETTVEQVWGRFYVDVSDLVAGTWVLKCAADALEPISEIEWKRVWERFAAQVLYSPTLLGAGAFT